MYTSATSTVTTGQGNAKQEIEFDYQELRITTDVTAEDLVLLYGEKFTFARIVKILNTKSERDAGNLARTKFRIKVEDKVVHAIAWGLDNLPDETRKNLSNKDWLLQVVWPQAASSYEQYGGSGK